MGKAERQTWAKEGYACLQEIHWSEANECGYEKEAVGDDEGKVGEEEEDGIDRVDSPPSEKRPHAPAAIKQR